jgi:hypothetical protein
MKTIVALHILHYEGVPLFLFNLRRKKDVLSYMLMLSNVPREMIIFITLWGYWVYMSLSMTQDSGNSKIFDFSVPDHATISNLRFISAGSHTHVVWNQDDPDKGIFLSSSDEAGLHFTEPKKIINTTGEVKDVQIIANGLYIVITIVETVSGSTYLRAATGIMRANLTHEFKPCEKVLVKEEIIDVYTVFTESASEDHVYVKMETTRADGKVAFKIERRTYSHCSRLSLV